MILRSFDVETDGILREYALQPWRAPRSAWLSSCAWTTDEETVTLFKPDVAHLAQFLRTCAAESAHIVGWNVAFDIGWLLALGLRDLVYANKWLDGMLLYKHLTNYPKWHDHRVESYSLKEAVRKFLPEHADYEKDVEYAEPEDAREKLLWQVRLLHYNKLDAELTLALAEKFLSELSPATKRNALIEATCLPMVAEATVEGLTTDPAEANALATTLVDTQLSRFMSLKMADMTNVTEEVLASPKQLSELLYTKWGLPVPSVTATGQASTDKAALARLALHDDRAALLHEWREARNNRTKFCEGIINSSHYNGWAGVHPDDPQVGTTRPAPRVFGTYTGRMTYSSKQGKGKGERPTGVALHQWKRDPAFRKLLRPPADHTLLEFDFAGQEYRWMAVESGDPVMLQMCAPGEDPHSFMGSRIARSNYHMMMALVKQGEPQARRGRQLGKVANLSLQYRTSAGKLQEVSEVQHRLPMTLGEARAIHGTYQQTYREVPRYWERQIFKAKRDGYVTTIAGRTVQLGTGDTWNYDHTWGLGSTAINFPIQGAGADQKYLALLVLRDYLPKVDGRLYFELHDGVFVIVPDHYAQRAAKEIKHLLSNLPYKKAWGVDLPINFPVDAKLGPSWGELTEWTE